MNELHLFAGTGGGILGGLLLGHTCVCAVEIEPYCQKVLLQRQRDGILPRFPIWDDIRTFDGRPWREIVDVVCGGFPCQDISAAGRGAGLAGERSGLWSEMARVVGEVKPRYVFVENSPMLTGRGLDWVLMDLAKMGYDAEWCVLGADNVGAPHIRKRIWILAYTKLSGVRRSGILPGQRKNIETVETKAPTQPCRSGNIMAHALLNRWDARRSGNAPQEPEWWKLDRGDIKGNMADPNVPGLSERGRKSGTRWPFSSSYRCNWWDAEPDVGRVAHGVASRVDRLKAIGNGQVPAVAALAWNILYERILQTTNRKGIHHEYNQYKCPG